MRVLLLLCVLCYVVCVSAVDLNIFSPNFKDPYSGLKQDTLLDVDVENACVDNVIVQVIIPLTSDVDEGNAHFEGQSFGPKLVSGISTWSGVAGGGPASLKVSWDGTSTLTFSGFKLGETAGKGTKWAVTDPWFNLNFDVPDNKWDAQLPLTLKFNSDVVFPPAGQTQPTPFINLNRKLHFAAKALLGVPCQNIRGDPVFAGFQGQVFQFHGLPDEHFNLVSSPDVQLNSHFVYLSSGKCDYNDTECFTHPGTYMDVLGFSIAETHVKLVAGSHEAGLRVWVNEQELTRGAHVRALSTNTTAALRYHHNGRVEVNTEIMNFEVVNSDMFMNIRVGLNNPELLRVGAVKHTVTNQAICRTNQETHDHQLVESTVSKKYPVTTPLHGLIGQTWRNVKVCGRDWMGVVADYVVSDLYASDYHYNYFKWASQA